VKSPAHFLRSYARVLQSDRVLLHGDVKNMVGLLDFRKIMKYKKQGKSPVQLREFPDNSLS
jgi:hypothetical protein